MKRIRFSSWHILALVIVLSLTLACAAAADHALSSATAAPVTAGRSCIVIDAGHGGVDGGATSCTGVLESSINLQIALKLNDLFHLLGYQTKMIRTTDISVYTSGTTIAQKKVSDLKERLRIISATENALLVSIHQNQFQDSQYSGAQVFYAGTAGSADLAKALQSGFRTAIDPANRRLEKKSTGVYLMEHIQCPGVLIECGFLSNPREEALLRSDAYQKNICAVIASEVSVFLDRRNSN